MTSAASRARQRAGLALVVLLLTLGTAGVAATADAAGNEPTSTPGSSTGPQVGGNSSQAVTATVGNGTSTLPTTNLEGGAHQDGSSAVTQGSEATTTAVPAPPAITAPSSSSEQVPSSSLGQQTTGPTTPNPETPAPTAVDAKPETLSDSSSTTGTGPQTTTTPGTNHSEEATVRPSTTVEGLPPNTTNRSEATSPNATAITTVVPTTLTPTTTRRRLPEVTEDDVVMKSTPTQRRLLLVLRGNCSHENLKNDVEGAFRNISSAAENISVTDIRCTTLLDVNVTLKAGEMQLKQLLRNLSLAGTLQLGDAGRQFLLTDFSVKEQVSTDGARTVRSRWVPTREELIIYVAVAVLFGIVLIIACVVCSIRCCRRQPSKTLDFLDTPRLNMRLEDYTLTRIPRPHTVYADHLRTPDQELGVVQAFDTCVVPLEDVVPPPPPRPPCLRHPARHRGDPKAGEPSPL
uniref:Putative salivary gland secretion 1 n=1 Tax=Amblyomma triste TaxID=251400 RepID=A0A023G621_AMBTT